MKAIRLPKACPAAEMPHAELSSRVEQLHHELHADGATAADKETALRKLRKALTPRRADKAHLFAGQAANAAAPAPAAFQSVTGLFGVSSSSSSPSFGGYKSGNGG